MAKVRLLVAGSDYINPHAIQRNWKEGDVLSVIPGTGQHGLSEYKLGVVVNADFPGETVEEIKAKFMQRLYDNGEIWPLLNMEIYLDEMNSVLKESITVRDKDGRVIYVNTESLRPPGHGYPLYNLPLGVMADFVTDLDFEGIRDPNKVSQQFMRTSEVVQKLDGRMKRKRLLSRDVTCFSVDGSASTPITIDTSEKVAIFRREDTRTFKYQARRIL